MTSKDAQQPEEKSETAEERATRLEAELKQAKEEVEKAKKALEDKEKKEKKEKKAIGGGGRKRKQEEEDAVLAGAPKGPRQQWKKPKRQERPQGNFGAWPPQATAPYVPAQPLAPSFGYGVQETALMPMPPYLPYEYRQMWILAVSFSQQVDIYRRFVQGTLTFYLAPPAGLSQEHVRLWIGGSAEEQRGWAARLEQEQRGGGPGVLSGPPATYGAPGGAYGQQTGFFTPLAPRAPAGRIFPTWPPAQNPPVANQTAPYFGSNQWVSEGYAERQPEMQRVRVEKAKKEKEEKEEKERKELEEKEAKEKKEKEEKEEAEKMRQAKCEKNKRQRARRREKKLALKQAKDEEEVKEEIKEEEMDSLSAPWFETDSNVPS